MLKKINRLQKDRDFMKVFKIAKPVNTENFSIRILYRNPKSEARNPKQIQNPNTQTLKANSYQLPARIGIVISNKIDKRATRRNELKRKIRAIVRNILPGLNSGLDIIIQVKKAPEYPYDFKSIKKQIESVLKK